MLIHVGHFIQQFIKVAAFLAYCDHLQHNRREYTRGDGRAQYAFATLDSITAGKLDGVVPAPYGDDSSIDAKVWEFRHLAHLFEQAGQFDLIHNQADFPAHAFARLTDTPIVTTSVRSPSPARGRRNPATACR